FPGEQYKRKLGPADAAVRTPRVRSRRRRFTAVAQKSPHGSHLASGAPRPHKALSWRACCSLSGSTVVVVGVRTPAGLGAAAPLRECAQRGAGMDHRRHDAVFAAVHGQLVGHALHRELGRGVGDGIRPRRLRRHASHVDDPPALRGLCLHLLDRRAAHQEDRGHVGGDHVVPVLEGHLVDRLAGGHARVVDQDVDAAVGLHRLGEHRRRVALLGDVGGSDHRLPALGTDSGGHLVQHRFAACDDHGLGTLGGEQLGDAPADARAGARNNCDYVFKLFHRIVAPLEKPQRTQSIRRGTALADATVRQRFADRCDRQAGPGLARLTEDATHAACRLTGLSIPIFAVSLASVSLLNNNIILFYLAWLAVPLCGLGAWPISYLKATSGWFERRLGLALGLTNAGIGVGAAILPVIIAFVITNYGWRSAY